MEFEIDDKVLITKQTPGVSEDSFDSVGAVGTVVNTSIATSGCAIEASCQRTGRVMTFWYGRDDFEPYKQNVDEMDSDAAKRFIDDF